MKNIICITAVFLSYPFWLTKNIILQLSLFNLSTHANAFCVLWVQIIKIEYVYIQTLFLYVDIPYISLLALN